MYILDGLLKNLSDIQPDTLYADTQGQSGPVFAISYLLGIKLMPRIRNWKDLTFLRPSESATYKYIDLLFKALSPFITRHIKRYGDYVVNLQSIPQPLEAAMNLPPEIFET